MDWKKQWNDISGNVKFWLLAKIFGGGSTLTALAAFWASLKGIPHADSYLYASLFIVSVVLFLISDRRIAILSRHDEPRITVQELAQEQLEAEAQEPDRYGKFSIEMLDGYVGWKVPRPDAGWPSSGLFILFKVRVARHDDPAAKIKTWVIESCDYNKIHDGWWLSPLALTDIPVGLRCRPLGHYNEPGDSIPGGVLPSITDVTYQTPIAAGDSKDGFLLVDVYAERIEAILQKSFRIRVTDVLGSESGMRIHPGEWLAMAEFSIAAYVNHDIAPLVQEVPPARGLLGIKRSYLPPPE